MLREKKAIVRRYEGNPILTGKDFPNDIVSVFNSGVIKQAPDKYTMVCRAEDSALGRYLWVADSKDGIHFKPRPKPLEYPKGNPDFDEYVGGTVSYYDPRVVKLDGKYYITHAAHTRHNCSLGLFEIDSKFEKLTWLDLIGEPDNRNGVLFPEKVGGYYWRLDRPNVPGNYDLWVSRSPDLLHWGHHRCILSKYAVRWADSKIGGGAPPIKTKEGWLCVIHAVRVQCTDFVYSLGLMLLDLNDPTKLIGVSKRAILDPVEVWEHLGQAPHVVFTCAAIPEPDGTVKIYYGAADKVMALAIGDLDEMVWSCTHE